MVVTVPCRQRLSIRIRAILLPYVETMKRLILKLISFFVFCFFLNSSRRGLSTPVAPSHPSPSFNNLEFLDISLLLVYGSSSRRIGFKFFLEQRFPSKWIRSFFIILFVGKFKRASIIWSLTEWFFLVCKSTNYLFVCHLFNLFKAQALFWRTTPIMKALQNLWALGSPSQMSHTGNAWSLNTNLLDLVLRHWQFIKKWLMGLKGSQFGLNKPLEYQAKAGTMGRPLSAQSQILE